VSGKKKPKKPLGFRPNRRERSTLAHKEGRRNAWSREGVADVERKKEKRKDVGKSTHRNQKP